MLTGALTVSQQCDVVTLSGKASLVITGGSSMQRDRDSATVPHSADRPSSKMLVPVGWSEFTFTDIVPDSFFTLQSSTLINTTSVSITEYVTLVEKKVGKCFMDAAQLTSASSL